MGYILSDGILWEVETARRYIPPQIIFMLDDTIRANEAFGIPKDEVSDAQVWRALEKAH